MDIEFESEGEEQEIDCEKDDEEIIVKKQNSIPFKLEYAFTKDQLISRYCIGDKYTKIKNWYYKKIDGSDTRCPYCVGNKIVNGCKLSEGPIEANCDSINHPKLYTLSYEEINLKLKVFDEKISSPLYLIPEYIKKTDHGVGIFSVPTCTPFSISINVKGKKHLECTHKGKIIYTGYITNSIVLNPKEIIFDGDTDFCYFSPNKRETSDVYSFIISDTKTTNKTQITIQLLSLEDDVLKKTYNDLARNYMSSIYNSNLDKINNDILDLENEIKALIILKELYEKNTEIRKEPFIIIPHYYLPKINIPHSDLLIKNDSDNNSIN